MGSGLNPAHPLFFLVRFFVVLVVAIAVFFLALALVLMVASAAMGLGRYDRGDNNCCGEEK